MPRFIKTSLALLAVGLLVWMSGCATTETAESESAAPLVVQSPAEQPATYWPVGLNAAGGELVMYQPQPISLVGDELPARAAVSWTPTGGQTMYGTAEFTARIMTDRDSRMVALDGISAIHVHVPGAAPDQEQQFAQAVTGQLPGMGITFPLDQLLASLDTAETAPRPGLAAQPAAQLAPVAQFNNDPPKILFSYEPATLISINGPPRMLAVEGYPGVMEVVNTPFILVYYPADKHYYLKGGDHWAVTSDLTGNWRWTSDVPADVKAAGDYLATPPPGQAETQPGTAAGNAGAQATSRPTELAESAVNSKIIVSTDPAELVVFTGKPQFTPIPGGQLLYASNTQADVFLYQPTQKYYLLLAGRWYIAPALLGPWQYLQAAELPPDFADIPVDSPRANVLASVPETSQARDAVLNAEIPQTASVSRDAGKDLNVAYDGQPRFQQAGGGPVSYALNTPYAVLSVNGMYYCCDDAVWYQAPTPTGPWAVCTSVPSAIYSIPPSCPDYNVTYCYVYDVLPNSVYCGYLPGYTGCYVEGPTVVYGTGYNYGGWFGTIYFPYACTWGFCAQYDIWTCDWGFGLEYPWWGTGWFAHHWHDHWWRDHWHQYGHRDPWLNRWWGPRGYVNYRRMASHNAAIRQAAVRGEEYGGRGRQNIYERPRNVARNITSENRRVAGGLAMPNRANDLFAGRNGDVYRRLPEGWEQRGPAEWNRVAGVPGAERGYESRRIEPGRVYAPPESGMQRDFAARQRGEYRANTVRSFPEYHGYVHGGGAGGGFHGGGGGFHGGGGGGFHGGGGRR